MEHSQMKQGLLVGKVLLLTAATNAFAADDFEGFFVQGSIGYNAFLAEDDAQSSAQFQALNNVNQIESLSNSHHEYSDGVAGAIGLGYLYSVNDWFSVGAQLGLGILKEDITVSSNQSGQESTPTYNQSTALHAQDTISREALEPTLDLLLGVAPTDDFMVFGFVGMAYNEVELNSMNVFDYAAHICPGVNCTTNEYAFTQTDVSESNSSVFLRLGLGMFYELYDDVVFNVNYIYTDYRDISTASSAEINACNNVGSDNTCHVDLGDFTSSSEVDLDDHRVLVGLNYFF
jgi:opacity protein-like surface antigen